MSTTSMVIFSNPLFATYSVYARNASIMAVIRKRRRTKMVQGIAKIAMVWT